MTPRWKIRRGEPLLVWGDPWSYLRLAQWVLYLDGEEVTSYFLWENAITHVDNWFYDQTLRGAR